MFRNSQASRAAVAGETFSYARLFAGETFTVEPKADGKEGQWVCATCGIPLANNMELDFHRNSPKPQKSCLAKRIGPEARHVLVWRNFVTGNHEVP